MIFVRLEKTSPTMKKAEKYLHPVRNIYLMRLREIRSTEEDLGPEEPSLSLCENLLASYEYYGFMDVRRAGLCLKMANLHFRVLRDQSAAAE